MWALSPNKVAINIDDCFHPNTLQTEATSIFVGANESENVRLSVIG